MVTGELGEAGNSGTLGMTILFGNAKYRFQDELLSRPERGLIQGKKFVAKPKALRERPVSSCFS